ncbi:hypothetical protein [Yinghuangia sp. YIM S09857]|uniref:hypothetical protein n=1 Tax=Yinghuangia sp. YIM S09857 TaxID=3436929 RepID=UPI003F53BC96
MATSAVDAEHASRRRALRRWLGIGGVVACLPYLGLKLLWVCGVDVGVVDRGDVSDAAWVAVNLVTFAMDGVAALIAYALTRPGGPRVRAWLVALPMWVASGLLAVIMAAVPLSLLGMAFGTGNPFASDGFLEPWVYALVYGGFIVEGVVLLGAFGLFADERWAGLLRASSAAFARCLATGQRAAGYAAACLLVVAAAARVAWACGATSGLSAERADALDSTRRIVESTQAGFMVLGAAGLLLLLGAFERRNVPVRVPLALAWVGGAVASGWGGVLGLTGVLVGGEESPTAVMTAVYSAETAAGLLMLGTGLRALGGIGTRTKGT